MLVLSRKKNQTIHIGDDIVIHVCQVKGSVASLGIEAPDDIRIIRGELPNWRMPGNAQTGAPGWDSSLDQPPATTF